jgi:hypothetical protein
VFSHLLAHLQAEQLYGEAEQQAAEEAAGQSAAAAAEEQQQERGHITCAGMDWCGFEYSVESLLR